MEFWLQYIIMKGEEVERENPSKKPKKRKMRRGCTTSVIFFSVFKTSFNSLLLPLKSIDNI